MAAPLPGGWTRVIIVIDDCSDDAAALHARDVVARLAGGASELRLLRHTINRGKGAALQSGFDHVLSGAGGPVREDDLVIIQDADLEYDPEDYPRLIAPLVTGAADAVVGTRWGAHRPLTGMTARIHAAGNRVLTLLSNIVTGYRVRDMECCYKVLPVRTLRRIRPWLTEPRFGIEPQIVAALARIRARVEEVPVAYDPRGFSDGKKIGVRDGFRAIWVILRERLRRQPATSTPAMLETSEITR